MEQVTMRWRIAGAAVAVAWISSANAQPPPPDYAAIPPPRYETVPPPPGPRMVWEPGHWHWNGASYIWIGGHYIVARPHHLHWIEGRWVWAPRAGRWVWAAAHWG